MGNWRALGSWIRDIPTSDPIDRRNAVTVQVLCLGLTVLLAVQRRGQCGGAASPGLRRVPGRGAGQLAVAGGDADRLVADPPGEVRPAFWLVSGGMVLILSVSLVIRGYHYHQIFLLRTSGHRAGDGGAAAGPAGAVDLPGGHRDWRDIGKLRDKGYLGGAGPRPARGTPLGMLGSTLLTLALFALVMDRFGSTLRPGLRRPAGPAVPAGGHRPGAGGQEPGPGRGDHPPAADREPAGRGPEAEGGGRAVERRGPRLQQPAHRW